MQYWIFFQAGVGGDGFANLLEHANNVIPVDNKRYWRIQTDNIIDGKRYVKFLSPNWYLSEKPSRLFRVP